MQKKKKQEMMFLGRIQHCYHKEKDLKIKTKEDNESKIRQLEEEEKRLIEELSKTLSQEKEIKAR